MVEQQRDNERIAIYPRFLTLVLEYVLRENYPRVGPIHEVRRQTKKVFSFFKSAKGDQLLDPPLLPTMRYTSSNSSSSSSDSSSSSAASDENPTSEEPPAQISLQSQSVHNSKSSSSVQSKKRSRALSQDSARGDEAPKHYKRLRKVVVQSSSSSPASNPELATHHSSPKDDVSHLWEPTLLAHHSLEDVTIEKTQLPKGQSVSIPASHTHLVTSNIESQAPTQDTTDDLHTHAQPTLQRDAMRSIAEGESIPDSEDFRKVGSTDDSLIVRANSPHQSSIADVDRISGIKTFTMPTCDEGILPEQGKPSASGQEIFISEGSQVPIQDSVMQLADDPSIKSCEARNPDIILSGGTTDDLVPKSSEVTLTGSQPETRVVDDVVYTTETQHVHELTVPISSQGVIRGAGGVEKVDASVKGETHVFDEEVLGDSSDDEIKGVVVEELKCGLEALYNKHEELATEVSELKSTVAKIEQNSDKLVDMMSTILSAQSTSVQTPSAGTASVVNEVSLEQVSVLIQEHLLQKVDPLNAKLICLDSAVRSLGDEVRKEHKWTRSHIQQISGVQPPSSLSIFDDDKKGEDKKVATPPRVVSRSPTRVLRSPPAKDTTDAQSTDVPTHTTDAQTFTDDQALAQKFQQEEERLQKQSVGEDDETTLALIAFQREALIDAGYKKTTVKKMSDKVVLQTYSELEKAQYESTQKESQDQPQTKIVEDLGLPPSVEKKKRKGGSKSVLEKKKKSPVSIDTLITSASADFVGYVQGAVSMRRNIVSWMFNTQKNVMVCVRSDGSQFEIVHPFAIKKMLLADLEDMHRIGLKNPSKALNGQIAVSLLDQIMKKREELREISQKAQQISQENPRKLQRDLVPSISAREWNIDTSLPTGESKEAGTVIAKPKGMYFYTGKTLRFLRTTDIPFVPTEVLLELMKQVKEGEYSKLFKKKMLEQIYKKKVKRED